MVFVLLLYIFLLQQQAEPFAMYNLVRLVGLILYFLPVPPLLVYLVNVILIDNIDCSLFPGILPHAGLSNKCPSMKYQRSDKLYDAASRTLALLTFPYEIDPFMYALYGVRTVADLQVSHGNNTKLLTYIPNLFEVYLLVRYLNPPDPLLWFLVGSTLKLGQEYFIHGK